MRIGLSSSAVRPDPKNCKAGAKLSEHDLQPRTGAVIFIGLCVRDSNANGNEVAVVSYNLMNEWKK